MDVFKVKRCDFKMFIFFLFLWFGKLSAEGTKCEINEKCHITCRYNATLEVGYSTSCKYINLIAFKNTDIDSDKFKNLKHYSFAMLFLERINNIQNIRHAIKGLYISKLQIQHHNIKELTTDMFEETGPFNIILLYYNRIEILQQKSLPKAKEIHLWNNFIKTITSDMFRDISYVTYLQLGRNHIKKITASSLIGLKTKTLSLSFNHLEDLENILIPEVENMFMNGNKLVSIHSKIFVNISKIKILDVSFNKITDFSFRNSMFQRLNMKNNKITHLSKKSFLGMNMLNEIILSNNMISSLEMKSLPLVKNLDLSHNLLSSIDLNMFTDIDQVRHLDLTHNCIKQINLKFTKEVNFSIGIFNKMCNDIHETDKEMSKSNDIQETDNEMSKSNDIQEMDNVLISKNILYIIGAVIVVAVLLVIIIVIIYSRRFYKYSKKAVEPRVVFNNELIPNAIPNDNNGGYVEPAHVYEVINNNAETQRESYGYLVPRSKKRQETGDEIRNISSKA